MGRARVWRGSSVLAACAVVPHGSKSRSTELRRRLFGGHDSDDSERGGDDDFNDNCEVPASEDAEMMGWDTYDDDYVGS